MLQVNTNRQIPKNRMCQPMPYERTFPPVVLPSFSLSDSFRIRISYQLRKTEAFLFFVKLKFYESDRYSELARKLDYRAGVFPRSIATKGNNTMEKPLPESVTLLL